MKRENKAYPIYQAVSEAQRASGLSFNFSYDIADKAVDVLLENWDDANSDNYDSIVDAVDGAVPVYNSDLVKIYLSDWDVADDAMEEYGGEGDSLDRARHGWFRAIESMVYAIRDNLAEIVEKEVKSA